MPKFSHHLQVELRPFHEGLHELLVQETLWMRIWSHRVPLSASRVDKLNASYLAFLHADNIKTLLGLCEVLKIPVAPSPLKLPWQPHHLDLAQKTQSLDNVQGVVDKHLFHAGLHISQMLSELESGHIMFDYHLSDTLSILDQRYRTMIIPTLRNAKQYIYAKPFH